MIFYFLLSIFSFLLFPKEAHSQELESQNYIMQGGNFNMAGGEGTSSNYSLVDLVGETSAKSFASKGYLIRSGFQNRTAGSSLTFSITPLSVNFGSLTPGRTSSKSLIFAIRSGEFPGFTVSASQNKPLSTQSGAEIPDTVCDAVKNKICSKDKGNFWTDPGSYGFGYSLDNRFYQPFPALSKRETPVKIRESSIKNLTDTFKIELKLNISKNQAVGIYQNMLNFTVLPGI